MSAEKISPIAVIKVGGEVVSNERQRTGLAHNINHLITLGWQIVVLHGGGAQISRLQKKQGLTPQRVGGRRITGVEDLQVVKQAVCGEVNVDLVSAFLGEGIPAFGCHGASGWMIQAKKRPPRMISGCGEHPVDFGEVGDVIGVSKKTITGLLKMGLVPVIATLGVDHSGKIFNINADTTVVEVAKAMQASALFMITEVGGVLRDPGDPKTRIPAIRAGDVDEMIRQNIIQGGMIPKVEESVNVLHQGVDVVAIVDADHPGAFSSVISGDRRFGTRISLS